MTNSSTSVDIPFRRRRVIGRLAASMLVIVLLVAGAWVARASLLRGIADVWIVSDPVTSADVVAVLGGGLEVRPFLAAEFYKKGLVPRVLVSAVPEAASSKIGGIPGHSELNRMVLLKLGVPDAAIEMFGHGNKNTGDEAVALRNWVDQRHVSRVIIPTEIFAARRVRWIFDREFSGSSVRVEVPSFEPPNYSRAEWWKNEAGMVAFQNEVLKYIYYRLK